MARALGLGCLIWIVAAACGGGGKSDAETALDEKSAFEVLEEARDDLYEPPSDGRLTEQQVEMYLKVKEREIELAKAAAERLNARGERAREAEEEGRRIGSVLEGIRALGSVSDVLTADVRAARELGYNSAEYQWVKQQVFESQLSRWLSDTARARQESLNALRKGEAEATTPEMKQLYRDQIAALERQFAEAAEADDPAQAEALRHNAELLKKYEAQLKRLDSQERGLPGSLRPPL